MAAPKTTVSYQKPKGGGEVGSNLFGRSSPSQFSAFADASNSNPYNNQAAQQALRDQNAASLQASMAQLQQAKEAASFGAMQGGLAQQSTNAGQLTAKKAEAQADTLKNNEARSGIGQGAGVMPFASFNDQARERVEKQRETARERSFGREMAQQSFRNQQVMTDRDRYNQQLLANNAASNQVQQLGVQQQGDQVLANIQGRNQLEAAKVAAQAQLGAAGIGAQSNMVSSLFGSLGNMVSNVGGGGGRRGYW